MTGQFHPFHVVVVLPIQCSEAHLHVDGGMPRRS